MKAERLHYDILFKNVLQGDKKMDKKEFEERMKEIESEKQALLYEDQIKKKEKELKALQAKKRPWPFNI